MEYIKLKDLIDYITRGSQIKANELNELRTKEQTNCQYLMLSHINNGILDFDDNEQFLTHIPKNLDRFCIHTEALVISKIGRPLKTVIIPHSGTKYLATGNVYVVIVNNALVDIRYLQSFLQSPKGLEALDNVSVNLKESAKDKNIKHISLERLLNMDIPVPSKEVQEEIAREYMKLHGEITFLNTELKKRQREFNSLWTDFQNEERTK